MIAVQCDNCGVELEKYPGQVKKHNFCNQQCCVEWRNKTGFYKGENHPLWNGGSIERMCQYCGQVFYVRRSQVKQGRGVYCSRKCARSDKSVVKSCEVCGKEFRIRQSHDVEGQNRYCSLECRSIGYQERGIFAGQNNPNYIDGKSDTLEYDRRKSQLRRTMKAGNGGDYTLHGWEELCSQYDNRCLACGRDDIKLTVDHIVPVVKGGSSDISNLQPLCLSCNSSKSDKVIDYR